MKTVTLHLPTEEELAKLRMGIRPSLEEVATAYARKRTRMLYGNTEGTIQLTFDR